MVEMELPVTDLLPFIQHLLYQQVEQSRRISDLELENADLRSRLLCYEQPSKDSHNSSIPPSKESRKSRSLRRTRSLRKPSGRKNGGQYGHKGYSMAITPSPDCTLVHSPAYCNVCGASLSQIEGIRVETRQSVDVPLPICPVTTDHVMEEKRCACGACCRGEFPFHVKPGVSYGVNVHAVVAYLSVVQHVPFKRLQSLLKDLYGISMSQGSISNILNRMKKRSSSVYEEIRRRIQASPVVGADETGESLDGALNWMWVFQNEEATYIFQDPSRGKKAIDKHFPEGLPAGVLVTDRHSPYFNMQVGGHQLCLAHLLRELIYLNELDTGQCWSPGLLELLRESIHLHKSGSVGTNDKERIEKMLEKYLSEDLSGLDKKFLNLQKSLLRHKEHILTFLSNPDVPADNNASERAIRPLKIKQKVSGTFKSENGADAFCTLYSLIDTAKKNGQDPFLALRCVAEL